MHLGNLLLVENEETGDYCCDLQLEHREQMTKLQDVLASRRQRYGGALALGARWRTPHGEVIEDGSFQPPLPERANLTIKDCSILPLKALEALLLTDKPGSKIPRSRKRNPAWCFSAICSPVWQGSGIQIGEEGVHYSCDFFKMPRRLTQAARGQAEHAGRVVSQRSGQLVIYRVGDFLDVCVGVHNKNVPTICYRFRIGDFVPGNDGPAATIAGVRPDVIADLKPGEFYNGKNVRQGTVLVTATKPVYYLIGDVDHERVAAFYASDTLSAESNPRQRQILRAFLNMNAQLSAGNNCNARLQEIRVLVEFPRKTLANFVVGEFQPTEELERDMLAALGPEGLMRGTEQILLKITADTSGKIRAISRNETAIVIVYENGREQLVPPTAVLNKLTDEGLSPLVAGMEVKVSEPIGDYIDRFTAKSHTFEELKFLLGHSIVMAIESLITRTSVIDMSVSDGMLIDYRYAYHEQHMKKSENKPFNQKIYLDCSTLKDLYDDESRFIIIPMTSAVYPLRFVNATSALKLVFGRKRDKVHFSHTDGEGNATSGEEEIEAAEA